MNKTQIKLKKEQIKMMDKSALEKFAASVHSSIGLRQETKDELLKAVDARVKELANSFSLEVEMSEVRDGEL